MLGIDPGTVIMGYSIISIEQEKITVVEFSSLKLPIKKDNYERLRLIHQRVTELVTEFRPHALAIEAPFFGKNVQSMLKLGRAQGVAIAAAMHFNIPVTEYSPRRIKQAITGNGNADKEQVWKMLLNIVDLPNVPKSYDATDALAVAICHHYSDKLIVKKPTRKKKVAASWNSFILKNPDRVA